MHVLYACRINFCQRYMYKGLYIESMTLYIFHMSEVPIKIILLPDVYSLDL